MHDVTDAARRTGLATAQPDGEAGNPAPGRALRLLLIEDSPSDIDLLRESLVEAANAHIDMECAASLRAGLDHAARETFDCLVLDLSLPDSEGMETVCKAREAARGLPIVVLTGDRNEDTGLAALSFGAQDYLVKGRITGEQFLRAVQYAMLRSQFDEHLRRADEAKETFLTAVAHDLRTPLTALLGLTATLRDHWGNLSDDERDRALEGVLRSAVRMGRLFEELLDIRRIRGRTLAIDRRLTDLPALISRVVTELQTADHRVLLSLEAPVVASVDPDKVERILANLLENACKFAPLGTHVTVSLQVVKDGVMLSVADRGPGVPKDAREQIFEMFRQGPASAKQAPGTGVGLAVVKNFARLHEGDAWVEDCVGGSACFCVYLKAEVVTTPTATAGSRRGVTDAPVTPAQPRCAGTCE